MSAPIIILGLEHSTIEFPITAGQLCESPNFYIPTLFNAYAATNSDVRELVGTFPTKEEAEEYLMLVLEEMHEDLGVEASKEQHTLLDGYFLIYSKVEEVLPL